MSSNSKTLSEYEILGPQSRGANSFVYKVKSIKNPDLVYALKVIDKFNKEKKPISTKKSEAIKEEIRLHSSLEHPNIVKLIDSFEDQQNYYMVLEFCETGELYSFCKKNKNLEDSKIRDFGLQLANGIKYLHDKLIFHRDLKLGNILIKNNNKIKICDFGLAKILKTVDEETMTICGTANYIPPEMVNEKPYGIKGDCWAFGCVIFALKTGGPPFDSKGDIKSTIENIKSLNIKYPEKISIDLLDLLKKIFQLESKFRFDINQIMVHKFFSNKKEATYNSKIAMELKNLNKIDIKKQLKKNYVDFSKESLTSKQQPVLASTKFVKKIKGTSVGDSHHDLKARFMKNYEKGLLYDNKKTTVTNVNNHQKNSSVFSTNPNRVDTAETKASSKENVKQSYLQTNQASNINASKSDTRTRDSPIQVIKSETRTKETDQNVIKSETRQRESFSNISKPGNSLRESAINIIKTETRQKENAVNVIKTETRFKDSTYNVIKTEGRAKDSVKQRYLQTEQASNVNVIKTDVSKHKSSGGDSNINVLKTDISKHKLSADNRNLSISSNNTKISEIGSIKKREYKSVKENLSPNLYNYEKNEKSIQIANSNYNSIRNSIGAKSNNYESILRSSSGGNTYNNIRSGIQRSSLGSKTNVIKPPDSITTNLFGSTAQTTQSKKGRCNSAYNVKKIIPTNAISTVVGSIKSSTGIKNSALKSYTQTSYNSKQGVQPKIPQHTIFSSATQRNTKTTLTTPQVEKDVKHNVVQLDNETIKETSDNIFATIGQNSQIFSETSPKFSLIDKNSECMKTSGETLQPFTINCLKETKQNIKHGVIEVLNKTTTINNNSNLNDCASTKGVKNICMTDTSITEKILKFHQKEKNLMIIITDDGKLIEIQKVTTLDDKKSENDSLNGLSKKYLIEKLPNKYWSFYNYARKVVDLLKSKIARVKLKNVYGTFTLMDNFPNANYEAVFTNGIKITTKVNGNSLVLNVPKEGPKTIMITQDFKEISSNMTKNIVKISQKFLKECLKSCDHLNENTKTNNLTSINEQSVDNLTIVSGQKSKHNFISESASRFGNSKKKRTNYNTYKQAN